MSFCALFTMEFMYIKCIYSFFGVFSFILQAFLMYILHLIFSWDHFACFSRVFLLNFSKKVYFVYLPLTIL